MKNNKNLDLDNYGNFILDFKSYSKNLFELNGVFSERRVEL